MKETKKSTMKAKRVSKIARGKRAKSRLLMLASLLKGFCFSCWLLMLASLSLRKDTIFGVESYLIVIGVRGRGCEASLVMKKETIFTPPWVPCLARGSFWKSHFRCSLSRPFYCKLHQKKATLHEHFNKKKSHFLSACVCWWVCAIHLQNKKADNKKSSIVRGRIVGGQSARESDIFLWHPIFYLSPL